MKELRLFVDNMQATSSSLDKVAILKQQSHYIQGILEYTYNPYKQYHVTSKTCIKNKNIIEPYFGKTIFDLLDDLNNRHMTGHAAIGVVNYFVNKNLERSGDHISRICQNIHYLIEGDYPTK